MTDASSKTIFISHATADDEKADRIAKALLDAGFNTWIDHDKERGMLPGDDWDAALRKAIETCDAAIFLRSPHSLGSKICKAECDRLISLSKPLYIAYIETNDAKDVWLMIDMHHYADLRIDFDTGIQSIIRVLHSKPDEVKADDPKPILGKFTGIETLDANLPYRKTVELTGRDADLEAIRKLLGEHVTQITAVGGTGKSRIAAEIALGYPSGAIWHRCTPASSAYEVLELIRQHVGLDEKATEKQLLDAIESAPPLVVIDNAEDVPTTELERRTAYVDLMSRLNSHKTPILLTSRVAWHELKPRREHPLEPLEEIDTAAKIASEFAEAEGVKLDDPAALATAAFLHPRLIEFAVRQLHERDLRQVLRQLRELTHEEVEEALTEMIHKTLEQMHMQAKNGTAAAAVLRRLTVFRGSFDYDAALALKPDEMSEDDVDDALVTLQRWGFIRRDSTTNRYRIDDVVIGALPSDEAASQQHFDYYYGLHGDYDTNRFNHTHHAQIEANWQNLRTALAWGLAQFEGDKELAKVAVDLVIALDYPIKYRVSMIEQTNWLERADATASNIEYYEGHAQILFRLADIAYLQADYPTALHYLHQAQTAFTDLGHRLGQANVLQRLADIARMQNDYPTALTIYQQAQIAFTDLGSHLGQAIILQRLGDVVYMQANYPAALTYYYDAQRYFTNLGDHHGQANMLRSLGDVAHMQADYPTALTFYRNAEHAFIELGDRHGQAQIMQRLGRVAMVYTQYPTALSFFQQARDIYEAIGDRRSQAQVIQQLGDVARIEAKDRDAVTHYQQALDLGKSIGDLETQLNSLRGMALSYQQTNDITDACDHWQQLFELANSHPAFRESPVIAGWRQEYAELGCDGLDGGDAS